MSSVQEYQLTKIQISALKFDESNPNQLTRDQEAALKKAMKRFGYLVPIVINENYEIGDGEHRARLYKDMGLTEIPAYIVPKINDDIERRLLRQTMNKLRGEHEIKMDADEIALIFQNNKLNDLSELLAQQRNELEDILTKHKGIQFQREDNFDVDKELEDLVPVTELGDIWQLGNHRIICADCSDERSINKLMDDKQSRIIFTDPPYGINYEYNEYIDVEGKDYTELCSIWFNKLKDLAPLIFITTGWKYRDFWYSKYPPDDEMIWFDKTKQSGGKSFYLRKTEPIMIWGKVNQKFDWDIIESQSDRGDGMRDLHSCPKPIDLPRRIITLQTNEDDIVLDPFLGSGSTLIACEQTNRICYGVEIDPRYIDIIIKRYQGLTGKEAIRLKDNKTYNELKQGD